MVGMIRNSWLLPPNASESDLQEAYQIYRIRDGSADDPSARTFRKETGAREIEIKFLGVWDTVGALGIPLQSFGRFNADFYKFHDTELSRIVKNAYHAVAIDEHREAFKATLWDPKEKPGQTIEQRWFVGAHGDIGGGNSSRKLSDIGLRWMQLKAQKCGLRLDASGIPPKVDDGFLADIYDSFGSFLAGVYHFFGTRYYRPLGTAEFGNEALHSSVYQRSGGDKNYRPRNEGYATLLKAQPGEDD
jgi:hypothetical protein